MPEISDIAKETIYVLDYFNPTFTSKIPANVLNGLRELAQNSTASINIDKNKKIEEQNIFEETKDLISLIYYSYIAQEEEKKKMVEIWKENEILHQKEIRRIFMNYEPIFLEPVFKDYIWGGQKLKKIFNKNVQNEECTAESWEISTNKNGESTIKNGKYTGKTLTELFNDKKLKEDIFGTKCVNLEEFPLLIKFIDANNSLSVQVHPDNEYAMKNENSKGKTEMWFILDCEPGAQIICGVKPGVTKEMLKEYMNSDKIAQALNYIDVKKGDAIYIPSGTIHALLGKTLVAEVQQNSNVTYRVYDWKRLGKDGKPRELHINKALDVIDTKRSPQIKNIKNDITKINVVTSEFFIVNKINVKNKFQENISGESFIAFNVIEGNGSLKTTDNIYEIKKGDSFIIPACIKQYELLGEMELLQSYV